jgi:hypothetical protein
MRAKVAFARGRCRVIQVVEWERHDTDLDVVFAAFHNRGLLCFWHCPRLLGSLRHIEFLQSVTPAQNAFSGAEFRRFSQR